MDVTREPTGPLPLTAILVVCDEEENVEECLQSVHSMCAEILVLDSGSKDRTLEICRRYTDKIFYHPYTDSADQWAWAMENLPVSQEWILPLDADHVVSPTLRADLERVLAQPDPGVSAFYSRHQYLFWGAPMRGFKRYGLRIFRKNAVSVDTSERVDFRFTIEGRSETIEGILYEFNRKELSIDFWIDKHQKFSSRIAAEEVLRSAGLIEWKVRAQLFGTHDERIVWLKSAWLGMPLFVRPLLYFFYRYILKAGFLDGVPGLVYHFMQALWYRTLVDVKILGIRRQLRQGSLSTEDVLDMVEGRKNMGPLSVMVAVPREMR